MPYAKILPPFIRLNNEYSLSKLKVSRDVGPCANVLDTLESHQRHDEMTLLEEPTEQVVQMDIMTK